jgi:DNA-binding NarL/FixJ family response regulator
MNLPEGKSIRLLVVDDHQVTRLGLRALLETVPQFTIVGEAGSVTEAIAAINRLKPDLLLLDVRLPDGSGLECAVTCSNLRST